MVYFFRITIDISLDISLGVGSLEAFSQRSSSKSIALVKQHDERTEVRRMHNKAPTLQAQLEHLHQMSDLKSIENENESSRTHPFHNSQIQ
jgi:uncharacterized protein YlxW (UPF0749 family)